MIKIKLFHSNSIFKLKVFLNSIVIFLQNHFISILFTFNIMTPFLMTLYISQNYKERIFNFSYMIET